MINTLIDIEDGLIDLICSNSHFHRSFGHMSCRPDHLLGYLLCTFYQFPGILQHISGMLTKSSELIISFQLYSNRQITFSHCLHNLTDPANGTVYASGYDRCCTATDQKCKDHHDHGRTLDTLQLCQDQ